VRGTFVPLNVQDMVEEALSAFQGGGGGGGVMVVVVVLVQSRPTTLQPDVAISSLSHIHSALQSLDPCNGWMPQRWLSRYLTASNFTLPLSKQMPAPAQIRP
jgi:hypothetical protein